MESAFICDKILFSHIYELESRRSERDCWPSTYFYQIKIDANLEKQASIKEAGQHLLDILYSEISCCDVLCQLNHDQYVLILYDVDSREINRIKNNIYSKFSDDRDVLKIKSKKFKSGNLIEI